jgi:multidrug transporter EmrE-like cation transporter
MARSKKDGDVIDRFLNGINWKIGKFNSLPMIFGTLMALTDVVMMSSAKMVNEGTLSSTVGVPFIFIIYMLEPLLFLKALNYEGMVITNLTWDLVSDILVTLQGIFVFGETLSPLRWIGVVFAFIAIAIFGYTDSY